MALGLGRTGEETNLAFRVVFQQGLHHVQGVVRDTPERPRHEATQVKSGPDRSICHGILVPANPNEAEV